MKGLDKYKTQNPFEDEDVIFECPVCGTPSDKEGLCDSKACFKSDQE